ncbi:MAG: hypothetical protein L6Q76_33985, partial [Polyangiaceae bacterium]|nr:hypothetical protein [Polyangiaceae bacterium]
PTDRGGPGTRIDRTDLVKPTAAAAAEIAANENPSYESGSINANVVLRWEYRAGSTLYAVYTHAQGDDFTPLGRPAELSFGLIKPRVATDIFLVKLSYWWG